MGKAISGVSKVVNKLPAMGALGLSTDDKQGAYADTDALQAYYNNYDKNKLASETAIQNGAFTKGLFGTDGLQSQVTKEGTNLANQGFNLTPEDQTAYGQASGDISRQFGQQEQSVAQALARRGLGSGASGAAGAAFSGLQGNKNEMLAKAQTDIAQRRYQDTMKRLQANREMQMSLANQGNTYADQRFVEKGKSLEAAHNANAAGLEAQQAAVKPGLFSTIGQGLQAGVGTLATQAPGMFATGGMSSLGGTGSGMFGANSAGSFGQPGPGASTNYEKKNGYSNADWGGGVK